jgi:hypothetical protein
MASSSPFSTSVTPFSRSGRRLEIVVEFFDIIDFA